MDGLTAFFFAIATILFLFMVVPWIAIGMEAYWSWCLTVQRRIKRNRTTAAVDEGDK